MDAVSNDAEDEEAEGGAPSEAARGGDSALRRVRYHGTTVPMIVAESSTLTGDPALLAHCWVGAVHEAVRYWLESPPNERRPAEEVAGEVAEFNLRGIGCDGGPKALRRM